MLLKLGYVKIINYVLLQIAQLHISKLDITVAVT